MNKKEKEDKPLSKAEIRSVISLLNEILDVVQKDLAIDVANQKKLTDIDIGVSSNGKALEELQESCQQLGMKVDEMDKKLDIILVILQGPQILGFTLDQIVKEIK